MPGKNENTTHWGKEFSKKSTIGRVVSAKFSIGLNNIKKQDNAFWTVDSQQRLITDFYILCFKRHSIIQVLFVCFVFGLYLFGCTQWLLLALPSGITLGGMRGKRAHNDAE